MNTDDGYMRRLTPNEMAAERTDLLARLEQAQEVLVPLDSEERLVNSNRQQRRAWARSERKRLAAAKEDDHD